MVLQKELLSQITLLFILKVKYLKDVPTFI